MVDGKPADYGPIIKANQAKSTAYLLAASGDCIKGWRLFASKGRHFHKPVGELPDTTPASRSVVGIVVCQGDDLRPVMHWIGKHRITPAERIIVIHAPGVDMVAALKP